MSKHARQTQFGTPGRRQHVTRDQYFDVGRVGRKTGVTLTDTGIRDEYGMEPMSGIYSDPPSAQSQRSAYTDDGSADMEGLDSVAPDLDETLQSRKLPRFPPARSTPPRRSNITGSPRRQSTVNQQESPAQGAAVRRLNFTPNGVRRSIEGYSPFKPRHALRRSVPAAPRENNRPRLSKDVSSPAVPPSITSQRSHRMSQDGNDNLTHHFNALPQNDDLPQYNEEVVEYEQETIHYSTREELEGVLDNAETMLQPSPVAQRKRRDTYDTQRLSMSGDQLLAPSGRKRARQSLGDLEEELQEQTTTFASDIQPPSKRRLEKAPAYLAAEDNAPAFDDGYEDDHEEVPQYDAPLVEDDFDDNAPLIEDGFDDNGYDDENEPFDDLPEPERSDNESVEEMPPPKRKQAPRKKSPSKPTAKASSRKQRAQTASSDGYSDSETNRSQRATSRSNVRYRSTTPMEDATRTTRSGRPVIKPLDWWAGEAVIWKNGEVDGVIRANSVEPIRDRNVNKKRQVHKKKTDKIKSSLGAIDERDEDLMPSEWEDDVGVLRGEVAAYNHKLGHGDDNLVESDLAFAASSILTRSVEGSAFRYAKIQTLPYFGSGVVEMPPDAVKPMKNSRKMQMNFFVHRGKVQVTVATATTTKNPEPLTISTFNITQGGFFIIPRGNNYTITNVSSNSTALLFFSQGCEIEAKRDQDDD